MIQEKKREKLRTQTVDPGYLMMGMYLITVIVLLLIGWLGAAGAGDNSEYTETISIIQQERSVIELA